MIFQDEALPPSNYAIIRWMEFDQYVPEQAVTSYWVSTKVFFLIRFIITLYSAVIIWTDIGVTNSGDFFALFTNLTYVGLHAYLVTATINQFRYLLNKNVTFLLNQPAILNYMYLYLYSTVITFNIVTPVVYWSLLAKYGTPTSPLRVWLNVSVHGVSFFLMIFDVILNRMRLPIRMVICAFGTMVLYMFMTFCIYATTGWWVYPFLDWSQKGMAAVWYIVVGLVCVIAFFIQVLIHWVRDFIARRTGRAVGQNQQKQEQEPMVMKKKEDDQAPQIQQDSFGKIELDGGII